MKILLDTHFLIWALENSGRIPRKAWELISDSHNVIYYSAINAWELAIKKQKRPQLVHVTTEQLIDYCSRAGYNPISVTAEHALALETLERKEDAQQHNDPFDRMLLAQAKAEGMIFLTHDKAFSCYAEPNVFIV